MRSQNEGEGVTAIGYIYLFI